MNRDHCAIDRLIYDASHEPWILDLLLLDLLIPTRPTILATIPFGTPKLTLDLVRCKRHRGGDQAKEGDDLESLHGGWYFRSGC